MTQTCQLDLVGIFSEHLPKCCHQEGTQILTNSGAFICCRKRWKHIRLPHPFNFLDTESGKAYSVDRCNSTFREVCHSKILVDRRSGCFYRFCRHKCRWEVVCCMANVCDRS